jgi:zinc protease
MIARAAGAVMFWLAAACTTPAFALDIAVDNFKLPNGMEVVVIPSHRAPVVTQMVWYRVGAADEPKGKSGIAHFLEHLMFKGTPIHPAGAFSRLVRLNGGVENAFTTQDYTVYYQSIAKEHLPLVMELESDRMQNLILTDESVGPELQVVMEERRQRTDNNPSALLGEQMDATLFEAHPYGKPVIGWMSEVAKLTRQDALDFYQQYYQPENAFLVVAGDVTTEEVRSLANKYYGGLKNTVPQIPRIRPAEPDPIAERRVILRDSKVSSPVWRRVYLAPAAANAGSREALALELLAEIVGGGTTSKLYNHLVVDEKIAAFAGSWYQEDKRDYGEFGFYGSPNPGIQSANVEAAVDGVIDDLLKNGVTREEVDAARNRLVASQVYLLDRQDSLARMFGVALATGQSIGSILNWDKDISTITPSDVQDAARRVLDIRGSVTGILLPKAGSAANRGSTAVGQPQPDSGVE